MSWQQIGPVACLLLELEAVPVSRKYVHSLGDQGTIKYSFNWKVCTLYLDVGAVRIIRKVCLFKLGPIV